MTAIVAREDSQVYGGARIEFIRDKQIPRLEKAGFVKALGREWFWLGRACFEEGKPEEGYAAYKKVTELVDKSDLYYAITPYAELLEKKMSEGYKEKNQKHYGLTAKSEECRNIDGALRYWTQEIVSEGYASAVDDEVSDIFRNSSKCDGRFFADIGLGETVTGSDGTTLMFASDNETADTPAGKFDGCQLWITKFYGNGKHLYKSYYKDGVGIVKHVHTGNGVTDIRVLSSYSIKGGSGLIPLKEGNTWEYASEHNPNTVASELKITVSFADDSRAIISSFASAERLKYDENSWSDMMTHIRNDYCADDFCTLCDVSSSIDRAEELAETPMEKAHTKAAASVMRRIYATSQDFNPGCTTTGHWNFFNRAPIQKNKESLCFIDGWQWDFEWKNLGSMGDAEDPILYNDILGILQDATNCIWSDEWRVGVSPIVEYTKYDSTVKTQITCGEGGTITTKAGTFENCLKICLDISGMEYGLSYRGGKKVYYFADGIGIVRTENEYCGGAKTAVYELTSYEGTGEGFMPLADGLVRRYDALGLTDGFVGAAEYTYVEDEDGDIVVFADLTGIREVLPGNSSK